MAISICLCRNLLPCGMVLDCVYNMIVKCFMMDKFTYLAYYDKSACCESNYFAVVILMYLMWQQYVPVLYLD